MDIGRSDRDDFDQCRIGVSADVSLEAVDGGFALVLEGVARGLAREGAIVIVHGRNKTKTEQVAHDIISQGGRAYAVLGDLTNEDEVQRLVDEAQAFGKPVEIVINNAGGSGQTEDWTTTRSQTWALGYDRNVLAAVRITSCLLPSMRRAKWGRIVNISSLAALMPHRRDQTMERLRLP